VGRIIQAAVTSKQDLLVGTELSRQPQEVFDGSSEDGGQFEEVPNAERLGAALVVAVAHLAQAQARAHIFLGQARFQSFARRTHAARDVAGQLRFGAHVHFTAILAQKFYPVMAKLTGDKKKDTIRIQKKKHRRLSFFDPSDTDSVTI